MSERRGEAFTLVEVVIALGVLSFCLITLLGLLGVGLNNGLKSNDDTTVASMTWEVANNLRSETNLPAGFFTNYYFDHTGQATNTVSAAYYSCRVTTNNPTTSQAPQPLDTNFIIATLQFTWPTSVIPSPHTNTVYATIPPP
jgi:uncharacterized protein (TIGR02598 family)